MKKLSTWMIIAGIAIFMIPIVGKVYTDYQQDKLYEQYLAEGSEVQQSYEQLEQTWQDLPGGAEPDDAAAEDPAAPAAPAYKPVVLGRIQIPKIDEDLLLVEGVNSKDLKVGAGHIPGTALPGEIGNSAIAGHRNYTFGSYFNRLDELGEGDTIVVEYGKNTYIYEVYETLVVLPEDTWVLNQSKKDKVLTLVTCTPVRVATHRLIVHALLVE